MRLTTEEIVNLDLGGIKALRVAGYPVPDKVFFELKEKIGLRKPQDDDFLIWVEDMREDDSISKESVEYVEMLIKQSGLGEAELIHFYV